MTFLLFVSLGVEQIPDPFTTIEHYAFHAAYLSSCFAGSTAT
jgi:hypothetical protein